MAVRLELSFDLTHPARAARAGSQAYSQALDMCAWADQAGFHAVSFGEHHSNASHYVSSPIVMGAAASARTTRADIRVVVLAPFYSPLRLAEDLAVLTLANGGRTLAVLSAGYRPAEFDFYGLSLKQRPSIMEETVDVLQRAWSGESFTYRGRHIEIVSPVPDPVPRIVLGGASPLMARMTARLGLGFAPNNEAVYDIFRQECEKRGRPDPGPRLTVGPHFLYVTEDPDKAWAEIGPYVLENAQMYAGFLAGTGTGARVAVPDVTLESLNKSSSHIIATPQQCVDHLRSLEGDVCFRNHAMPAGLDPERVWESLELFESKVMPHLNLAR